MYSEPVYNSKILLFGEYGIIQNTMGLSVPYNQFKGRFNFESSGNEETENHSKKELQKFLDYLEQVSKDGTLSCELNLDALKKDLNKGMFFNSTVPSGFGVGSSGTIVAAIYGKYCSNRIEVSELNRQGDIIKLKNIFSEMESYFHGKSSGLDPLICYLNIPILIKSQNDLDTVGLPDYSTGKGAIFLLNTGIVGQTAPLVKYFLSKCKEEEFRDMIKGELKIYNDAAIAAFLNNDIQPLMQNVKQLSEVLLSHFKPMIPDSFHKVWEEGIQSNEYYLKLCGSGGGGFMLGFTKDFEKAKQTLSEYDLKRLYSI